MKKYILLVLVILLFPLVVLAANDVQFQDNPNIYIPGKNATLVASTGSQVDSFTVYPTYLELNLSNGSTITLTSSARLQMEINPSIATVFCGTDSSYVTLTSNTTQTVLVTPTTPCSSPGPSSVAPPTVTPVVTPVVTPSVKPITTTGKVTATPDTGAKTNITTIEGNTTSLELPEKAVSIDTAITLTPEAKATVVENTAPVPVGKSIVGGYGYNYQAEAAGKVVTAFLKKATVTLTYTDAQITGIDESTLAVSYFDTAKGEWVALPSTVDTINNTVTAFTEHLTYFVLIGEKVAKEEVVKEEEEVGKPITELTLEELKAKINEILIKLADLKAQLIQLLQQKIAEIQAEIKELKTQLP